MIGFRNIGFMLLVALIVGSCKKDDIEPIGFYQVDYYTNPNQDQTFEYYFDDGQLVAGGLDEYMVKVNSEAGTFDEEQLLLLKFKDELANFSDTLIPYTYFVGLNYQGQLNKPLTIRLNLNYPFNNPSHSDYLENQFFMNNLENMKLMKLQFDGLADIYYDPDFELMEIPFTIDDEMKDAVFQTADLNAFYVLCWTEQKWSDTLTFSISGSDGNIQDILHEGYRYTPINAEGASYRNGNLVLNYSPVSFRSENSANELGWKIEQVNLKIADPAVGIINHSDIELSCLLSIDNGAGATYTYLELVSNTSVEMISWPQINGYGELKISGSMRLQMTQSLLVTDFNIKFKRQR